MEAELASERTQVRSKYDLTVLQALRHPKVLLLTFAYFCTVTASYGVMFFLPTILRDGYALKFDELTWLVMLHPVMAFIGQLVVGWSSDLPAFWALPSLLLTSTAAAGTIGFLNMIGSPP